MNVVVILSKDIFAEGKKASTPSDFARKVKTGAKRHTVRANFDYWKKKIAALQEKGGTLSLRQWTGKPYRSPQETIIEIPASLVEVQQLNMVRVTYVEGDNTYYDYLAKIDGERYPISKIAENDGLTEEQFISWFAPFFDEVRDYTPLAFAVIHFTTFRY